MGILLMLRHQGWRRRPMIDILASINNNIPPVYPIYHHVIYHLLSTSTITHDCIVNSFSTDQSITATKDDVSTLFIM